MKKDIFLVLSVILAATISLLGFRLIFPNISTTDQSPDEHTTYNGTGGISGPGGVPIPLIDLFKEINEFLYRLLLGELSEMDMAAREELLQEMKDNVSDMESMEELLKTNENIDTDAADQIIEEMKKVDPDSLRELINTLADMDPDTLEELVDTFEDMDQDDMEEYIRDNTASLVSICPSPT